MNEENKIVFKKGNYMIMFAGLGLLVLGFIVMTMETAPYGFGPLGLTAGPLLLMAGFIVQFFAIMHKPKK